MILAPIAVLCLSSLRPFSAEQAETWQHIKTYLLPAAVKDTLILSLGSIVGALALGLPAAWVISQKTFFGKPLISTLLVLPLAIPAYIFAFLVTDIRESFIPLLVYIRESLGMDAYLLAEESSRYLTLIIIFSATLYPYVFLAARSAFAGNLGSLSEISLSLQRGRWQTFWRVQLPLARPAIVGSLFLVAMEVLNDYGAVQHFGFSTFTVTLFRTWFGLGELEIAQRLVCWILGGVLLIMWLERVQRGRRHFSQQRQPTPPPSKKLGIMERLALITPLALGFIFPLSLLTRWMVQSAGSMDATMVQELWAALTHSLALGLIVVATTVLFALIIVGGTRYTKSKAATGFKNIIQITGYASPGVIMAIGVLSIIQPLRDHNLLPEFTTFSSTTITLLAFALTCRYYSVASQMVSQALERLPRSYDEASQALGVSPLRGFSNTTIPLISPALLGASALVFVDVTKELPLSLLLRPFDYETLGTHTYGFVDQGQLYNCAFPSALLIGLCVAGLLAVEYIGWRKR